MAKSKRKIVLTVKDEIIIPKETTNYLFKVGKEFYLRLMPTPFKNIKPKLPKL